MSTLVHKLLEMTQNFCRMWMQNVRLEAVPAKVFSNHAESGHDSLSMCWPISGRQVSVKFCRLDRMSAAPAAALLTISKLTLLPRTCSTVQDIVGFLVPWVESQTSQTTQDLSSNTAKLKNLATENHRPMMGPSQGCQPVANTAETGMRQAWNVLISKQTLRPQKRLRFRRSKVNMQASWVCTESLQHFLKP